MTTLTASTRCRYCVTTEPGRLSATDCHARGTLRTAYRAWRDLKRRMGDTDVMLAAVVADRLMDRISIECIVLTTDPERS